MTGEIGQLALCLALALSLVQSVAGILGVRSAQSRTIRALRSVRLSGTLPATVVIARTSSRSLAPSANRIAIASS